MHDMSAMELILFIQDNQQSPDANNNIDDNPDNTILINATSFKSSISPADIRNIWKTYSLLNLHLPMG